MKIPESHVTRFTKGAVIYESGTRQENLAFFLVAGVVKIFPGKDTTGTSIITIRDGEFFGEMALLTGHLRTATAVVESDEASVIALEKKEFMALTESNAPLRLELCRRASRRYVTMLNRYYDMRLQTSDDKNLILQDDIPRHFDMEDFFPHLEEKVMPHSEIISSGKDMYWISAGTGRLDITRAGRTIISTPLDRGYFFGALTALNDDSGLSLKVTITSPELIVKVIEPADFAKISDSEPLFLYALMKLFLIAAEQLEFKFALLSKHMSNSTEHK